MRQVVPQAPVVGLQNGPAWVPVAQSVSAMHLRQPPSESQSGAAVSVQALLTPLPWSPLQGAQVLVDTVQVAVQSEFLVHRPQKPVALQLGAPCGQDRPDPEPKLPSHAVHEPAVGPLGIQNGAEAEGQAPAIPLP